MKTEVAFDGREPMTGRVEIVSFESNTADGVVVNDGVMGGVSRSRLRRTESGTAIFEGRVSLENDGGFASFRAPVEPFDPSSIDHIGIRVRGDGHVYQVRLRHGDPERDIAYRAHFPTKAGEWQTITVPLARFEPTRRGRRPASSPAVASAPVVEVGFLIADRQAGPFRLEIERVFGTLRAEAPDARRGASPDRGAPSR